MPAKASRAAFGEALLDLGARDERIVTLEIEKIRRDELRIDRAALSGPARHEHVHFHGLAAEQVAAILAARQQARPNDAGER